MEKSTGGVRVPLGRPTRPTAKPGSTGLALPQLTGCPVTHRTLNTVSIMRATAVFLRASAAAALAGPTAAAPAVAQSARRLGTACISDHPLPHSAVPWSLAGLVDLAPVTVPNTTLAEVAAGR
jgi:hypothetical protein